jgi:hypothetical protein
MVIRNVGFNAGGICNLVLFVGLLATSVRAIPVQMSTVDTIKYPIYVACECDYSLYVDDKYIHHDITEVKTYDYLETGWNATKRFYPYIHDESPKIIAFNGVGNQHSGLLNGFIMDMNNGKDYTKHNEWKCKDFSKTVSKVPPVDWFTFDYNDSDWEMSATFGKNYQNNSFQIYYTERREIHLQAEWLWTSDNTVSNLYCRKKNEKVRTIPLQTSAPHIVQTSAPHIVQTSAPHIVQTSAPHIVQTSTPHIVSKTIHATPVQTSAPHIVQTSAPHIVQTSAPHIVQTSAPHIVQTSAPPTVSKTIHATPVQTSAPHIVQTSAPHIVQTSAPHIVQTSAPHIVQTSAPHIVQTSAPHIVSKTIHATPVQTSAPHIVQTSAPHIVQTSAPPPPAPPVLPTLPVPTIVISPHIQIVINNIKYSQRRSNRHFDNLFRKIKLYNDEYRLYKQLTIARLHFRRHYNALFYDIKHVLEKHNTYDTYDSTPTDDNVYNKKTVKNIPYFIRSMHTLNASIKKIEESIQFIKGNHKYILLRILHRLKMEYQNDTLRLLYILNNDFK